MRQGFTLVELSIVLVIIGLLAGGVLVGQDMIRAAEMRSVITQVEQFESAIHTFRDKYMALPGDFNMAHDFWGANCDGTASRCNGNLDGWVVNAGANNDNEAFRAWQHLSLSGIIPGNYTGIGQATAVAGTTNPAGKLSNTAYHMAISGTYGGTINLITFGTIQSGSNVPYGGALIAEEAWSIDQKRDDGAANSGALITEDGIGGTATCVSGSPPNQSYNLSGTGQDCRLYFVFKQ